MPWVRPWQLTWGATAAEVARSLPSDSLVSAPTELTGQGPTRLITRVRSRYQWFTPSIAFSMLVEFGDIWMMRKMLLNLSQRAAIAGP